MGPISLEASVDRSIDLSLAVDDHFVVKLVATLPLPASRVQWYERRPRFFDPAQLDDPGKDACFVQCFEQAPLASRSVDVHTHAAGASSTIVWGFCSGLPLVRSQTALQARVSVPDYLAMRYGQA